jgi:NAD(P)-dependent dehydrogenase (short-subunit alcohol dehydrogenase family)
VSESLSGSGPRWLAGKHAVVTGGAKGIGAAVTLGLLAHVAGDVSDAKSVSAAFQEAQRQFGAIQILVNNAGQAQAAPFLKTDFDLWRRMMSINLDGTFHCTQAALPGMLEAGWGRVVNIASTAGLIGYGYVSAYCAAKHGIIGLTRSLALEVATKGVTVNTVCPGYTETDMTQETIANIVAKTGRSVESARAELVSRNPQKRMVQPAEVANAVTWLCFPASDAITGQAITVAGGEVM